MTAALWLLPVASPFHWACSSVRAEEELEEEPDALEEVPEASAEDDALGADDDDGGVYLPTDRLKDRQLDRARRLIAEARWSDAATLLDEMLAGERDCFLRPQRADGGRRGTWTSVKSEAARLIDRLPRTGREAYELQFRARAQHMLDEAVAADDAAAIAAVARRWFQTPAGQTAALLAAVHALESGQPLAAAAWLDRLAVTESAARLEPTLGVMRALAWDRAGDPAAAAAALDKARASGRGTARIAGKEVVLSFAEGQSLAWLRDVAGGADAAVPSGSEWRQPRGTADRNAIATASRPLLVPRFRVPLARHPEESRLLEQRRRTSADQDIPLFPAATPLAIDGLILARTPLGLLAVDFDTGKRVWLQPGPGDRAGSRPTTEEDEEATDSGMDRSLDRTFDDATSGGAASDGRLVFVIDSHPDAFASSSTMPLGFRLRQRQNGWQGGNTLSAYDLRDNGSLRWRLPVREAGVAVGSPTSAAWYMGAPLVVGERLFVLVEEKGEVRLDVLAAADGAPVWSQPLAELDEARAIKPGQPRARQRAGLSPALAGGVLVCPLGAGAVVAVDLATRTLRWAYEYDRLQADPDGGGAINGIRVRGLALNEPPATEKLGRDLWRDSGPIVCGSRVLLTPYDSDSLHCLDLREGAVAWKLPRAKRLLHVAGVVDGRVIVVGRREVEAFALETGRSLWKCGYGAEGAGPSGRGIVTADRLFLPLDTPEVVEIGLADGEIVGRSAARGRAVPGNLIAYRGEVISQGIDSLDVFHQAAVLESRVETAARSGTGGAWSQYWRGQLALERGDIRMGLTQLRQLATDSRLPPDAFADAVAFGMERDFAAAAEVWKADETSLPASPAMHAALRAVVDGFLRSGNPAEAWAACRRLFDLGAVTADLPCADPSDRQLAVTEGRWFRGRLHQVASTAPRSLRDEIDAFLSAAVASAAREPEPLARRRRLESLVARLGDHAAGMTARAQLAAALAAENREETPAAGVHRELLLLELQRGGDAGQQQAAAAPLAASGAAIALEGTPTAATDPGEAWPLGQVRRQRTASDRRLPLEQARTRAIPVAVENASRSLVPGVGLACDPHVGRLLFTDGYGRPIGDPLAAEEGYGAGVPAPMHVSRMEAAALGRVVYVRSGSAVAAVALEGKRGSRWLWTRSDAAGAAAPMPFRLRAPAGGIGIPRRGSVPLGLRGTEPEEAMVTGAATLWGRPCPAGVPLYANRSLTLLDPLTGHTLWERHRLPPATEIIGDDELVCVCTADGRRSQVLSMRDGRVLREVDLPDRRRRLLASGRTIVSIGTRAAPDGDGVARSVQLESFDLADQTPKPLGEFAGLSRATAVGSEGLAVVEPSGTLTLIDLERRAVRFQTRLDEMPEGINAFHVMPWKDRLLVMVGRHEPIADENDGAVQVIAPLQQMLLAGHEGQPMSYSVWAVERSSGAPLWSAPATVARHCLHAGQPSELPVLVFCRQIQTQQIQNPTSLSVLCLDKRTGHAVFEDDHIPAQPHMLFGCDVVGDPERHTITVREHGGDPQQMTLEFTGAPAPPRPPHQASGKAVSSNGILGGWDRWLERTLRSTQGR